MEIADMVSEIGSDSFSSFGLLNAEEPLILKAARLDHHHP
jgi:hypothetical protein